MARKPGKSQVLLDWFNVTYRSVFLGVAALVAVAGGGLGGWVYLGWREAGAAVEQAAVKYEEATVHGEDLRVREVLGNARAALSEARARLADRAFREARDAALRSREYSQKVIDLAGGQRSERNRAVRFFRIEGDVRVKRAGEFAWEAAGRSTALDVGDQVKTSASASAQIIYFDGTVTTVQPGSLLEIKELYENPATKVRKVAEKLNWGELMASTQRRNVEGSFHEVETENVTARTAEEGELRVAYDQASRAASFDVFGGTVEVAGPSRTEVVAAGERIRSSGDGTLAAKEVLPGAPRPVAPPDQRIFIYDDPAAASTRLAWERVPRAARYHLLISDRQLFTQPLYDAYREETSVLIDGVTPGDYYWKVSAVASTGVEGPSSEIRGFRVATQRIRDAGDDTPPRLRITEVVQTGAMLIINGATEPGAQVWVDNDKVQVSDDGTFYTVLRLSREGVNDLTIVAQDAAGNQEVITRQAYVESF